MLDKPNHKADRKSDAGRLAEELSSLEPADILRKLRPIVAGAWPWHFRAPALLALLLAIWYFGASLILGPAVNVDPVVRAEFVQSVVASGHVEAPFRVNIGSQITGVVADVPVAEGQSVKKGGHR
jgi:HlyD family secretion protein